MRQEKKQIRKDKINDRKPIDVKVILRSNGHIYVSYELYPLKQIEIYFVVRNFE